jgi:hypothetical protein
MIFHNPIIQEDSGTNFILAAYAAGIKLGRIKSFRTTQE